jgi:hypothetical protein
MDGRAEVQFSDLARQDVENPDYAGAGGSCTVYCHGSTSALGNHTSPAWTSTEPLTCGACHPAAPTSGWHTGHRNRGVRCDQCHPGYSTDSPAVNLATHVDGELEASPATTSATFSTWPSDCVTCHGTFIQPL